MTTDWTKQAEDMVRNWTDIQQKMMQSMFGMMNMNSMPTMSTEMWEKSVSTLHDSMKSALDAQVTWSQFIADSVSANTSSNQQINDMTAQAVNMTRQWSDTQKKVLDTWFETVRSTDAAAMAKMNPEEMMKSMQNWQTAAQKMMETQMEMVKNLTAPMTTPGGTAKK